MNTVIKSISKISIFSLIGTGLNVYLIYTFMRLWISPQIDDVEMISSLTMMVFFEFVLVHSGVFMSAFGHSWKAWLLLFFSYGIFAWVFNMAASNNQILILYCVVVLNRMLPKILNKEKTDFKKEILMSGLYAVIYFMLLVIVALCSSKIPQLGLNSNFFEISGYINIINDKGALFDMPHIIMCFGVIYYLMLSLVDIMLIVRLQTKVYRA